MDRVVLLGHRARHRQQPQPDHLQALVLEAAEDLADEPALHGVGLGEDEGALHHEVDLLEEGTQPRRLAARS